MSIVSEFVAFEQEQPIALYLHIPFCERKCPYCDFNTYAGMGPLYERFTRALVADIKRWGDALKHPPLHTVFIGGGTPTVLAPEQLASIMTAVREAFPLVENAEITSEANPGTVDRAKFQTLREIGINRLSLGVQSFQDDELRFLGRIHTREDILKAVENARQAGFTNINLDLMYGLPQQPLERWNDTLEQAIALQPTHLSCYALTVEEGTPLARWVAAGKVPATDDDLQGDMYALTEEKLAVHGFLHYEISNWARKGFASVHNRVYWHNQPYLGLGPGAHSYDGAHRWWTVRSPQTYIQRIEQGQDCTADWEPIDRRLAMAETMILGLRLLQEGVYRPRFRARFGVDPTDVYGEVLKRLVRWGMVSLTDDRIRLTPAAYAVGNQVFLHFLDA